MTIPEELMAIAVNEDSTHQAAAQKLIIDLLNHVRIVQLTDEQVERIIGIRKAM